MVQKGVLLINSIKYFEEKNIKNFEKLEDNFINNPLQIAEYVTDLTDELHKLGLEMIKESLDVLRHITATIAIRLFPQNSFPRGNA